MIMQMLQWPQRYLPGLSSFFPEEGRSGVHGPGIGRCRSLSGSACSATAPNQRLNQLHYYLMLGCSFYSNK